MSYSIDFRRKVIATLKDEGLSIRETAKQFRIGPASVLRWINQIDPTASITRQRKIDKSELIKDVEQYQMLPKKNVQNVLAFIRRLFGKLLKRWDSPVPK